MMARLLFRRMDDTYKRTHFWWRHSAEFTAKFKDDDLDNAYELLELEDDAGEKEIKACVDLRCENLKDLSMAQTNWPPKMDEHSSDPNDQICRDKCFFWFEPYLFDPTTWLVDKWWVHPRKACQQKQIVKHVCLPACVWLIFESWGLIQLQTYRCLVLWITSSAAFPAAQTAYRKISLKCHPDRHLAAKVGRPSKLGT